MNKLEGNKLIHKFMNPEPNFDEMLFYDVSWDSLMPVVEKIEKQYEVSIIGNECEIAETGYEWKSICRSNSDSKINAVWQTVVKFVENHV